MKVHNKVEIPQGFFCGIIEYIVTVIIKLSPYLLFCKCYLSFFFFFQSNFGTHLCEQCSALGNDSANLVTN